MKSPNPIYPALAILFSIALFAGCSKTDGDKSVAAPEKNEATAKAGVTIDETTQARIGLKIENPLATQWQPEVKGFGSVIDPASLTAAVSDLESARSAADLSMKELSRQNGRGNYDGTFSKTELSRQKILSN